MSKLMEIVGWAVLAVLGGVAAIAGLFILALVCSVPLWLLWNWLMPVLFGLKVITIWQALGLSLLSSILFKSNSSSK